MPGENEFVYAPGMSRREPYCSTLLTRSMGTCRRSLSSAPKPCIYTLVLATLLNHR